ncbi:hypothetical protein [Amazonocrinis nigriterrae]|nr:hypothetical protein [Amazonocrinis nigriterrae]
MIKSECSLNSAIALFSSKNRRGRSLKSYPHLKKLKLQRHV